MKFSEDYQRGFYAGENSYEYHEDESTEWKKGYEDGTAQAFDECPEDFI